MSAPDHICETDTIAAYIDGELEPPATKALEGHVQECKRCNSELQRQRLFMCELDSALAETGQLGVPKDFAKVIAAHAQSDMRGVRSRAEHRRALRFCIVLAIAAFALLGATSSKILIFSARSIVDKTFGIVGLIGRTLYDAAAGFTVIARVLSGGLVIDSRVASLTFLVLLALAIGLLSLLISRYHRTRLIE